MKVPAAFARTKINKDKIVMRAHAMRLANTLSLLEMNFETGWSKRRATHEAKDFGEPPPLRLWPEIDMDTLLPENSEMDILVDDGVAPAVWPIDTGAAFSFEGGIRVALTRTVKMSDVRGVARRIFPHNVATHSIDIDKYGKLSGWGGGYFGRCNKEWTCLTRGGNYASFTTGDRTCFGASLMIGNALRHRYEWSSVFSFPNGLKLRFGCSARGALELFKDRDNLDGGRRKALLHWVARHWRRTSDPEIARDVRKHLRGVTEINWRGQSVSIVPAEYEIELSSVA